jgi:hypothetical protein
MAHRTTGTNCRKIDGFLTKLKSRLLARVALRIFAAPDADARQHGWQITITNDGLGRIYRDPRFDRLRTCPACKGHGRYPRDTICSTCDGTGRIVLDQGVPQPGRGQP